MTLIDVTVQVHAPELQDVEIATFVERVLELEGASLDLSVVVLSDEEIRQINREFLGHNFATDVLAFDLREDGQVGPDGEILVSIDHARREAGARSHGIADELLFYVAHGVLHLLGYDDHDPEERARMHARQAHLMNALGRTVDPS